MMVRRSSESPPHGQRFIVILAGFPEVARLVLNDRYFKIAYGLRYTFALLPVQACAFEEEDDSLVHIAIGKHGSRPTVYIGKHGATIRFAPGDRYNLLHMLISQGNLVLAGSRDHMLKYGVEFLGVVGLL